MEKQVICGIYKITNPSGRVYIGQSEFINRRWRDYKQFNSKTKRQPVLWRSFKKYGVENHIFEIIEECSIEDLNYKERYWQDFYDVLNGGLNCVLQKCNEKRRVLSEKSKEKIRLNHKPRKITIEERERMRLKMIGNTFNKGRVRPQSEREAISRTMKKNGTQSKHNNSMWGKFGEDNPISKLILDTETGIFYYGVKEAACAKNLPYSSLKKMICGNRVNKTSLIYSSLESF